MSGSFVEATFETNVGRIFRRNAAHPDGRPWMWTIVFHERRGESPHQGSTATREEAKEAFRRAWLAGVGKLRITRKMQSTPARRSSCS